MGFDNLFDSLFGNLGFGNILTKMLPTFLIAYLYIMVYNIIIYSLYKLKKFDF